MKYRIGFRNLTKEQQDKFTEIYKSIPFDLVSEFRELADLMGLKLNVDVIDDFTFLTVISKTQVNDKFDPLMDREYNI